jgi:O-acetyl-ADP-ribose deacetylase
MGATQKTSLRRGVNGEIYCDPAAVQRGPPDGCGDRITPALSRGQPLPGPWPVRATTRFHVVIEVADTDITRLDVDAIANAANTELRHAGGVAAAISRAGGPEVQRESLRKAPIGLGEAVETTAGDLPARWVIHAATMELGGPTSAEIIRSATASTLRRADELGARSLALVAFGTGVGGFPLDEAARIEVEEVRRHLDEAQSLDRVVFAVRGAEAARVFEAALSSGA